MLLTILSVVALTVGGYTALHSSEAETVPTQVPYSEDCDVNLTCDEGEPVSLYDQTKDCDEGVNCEIGNVNNPEWERLLKEAKNRGNLTYLKEMRPRVSYFGTDSESNLSNMAIEFQDGTILGITNGRYWKSVPKRGLRPLFYFRFESLNSIESNSTNCGTCSFIK